MQLAETQPASVHFSVFSPPFADLYCYSDDHRDMGNCANDGEFFEHFGYLVQSLKRLMMPGRIVAVHCMDLPAKKSVHGFIGLRDFSGGIIQLFQKHGYIYHDRITIWKDPVIEMQRTKALGLLHKQIKKDSSMCRTGGCDYLLMFRVPGENPEPITHQSTDQDAHDYFPVDLWQKVASPVWMDINYSKTLQRTSAREERDEKHICPLQLETIERAIMLWSNKGDTVFSPFAGIGSEGFQAIKMGRKFIGIELKEAYYQQAERNLKSAIKSNAQFELIF